MEHWTGSQEDMHSFIHSCMSVVCNRLQNINVLKQCGPSCQAAQAMGNTQEHNQGITVPCFRDSDKKGYYEVRRKNFWFLLRQ